MPIYSANDGSDYATINTRRSLAHAWALIGVVMGPVEHTEKLEQESKPLERQAANLKFRGNRGGNRNQMLLGHIQAYVIYV